jgi:hypothetical protein
MLISLISSANLEVLAGGDVMRGRGGTPKLWLNRLWPAGEDATAIGSNDFTARTDHA